MALVLFLLSAFTPALAFTGPDGGPPAAVTAIAGAEGAPSEGAPDGGAGAGPSSHHGARCPCHHAAGGPAVAPAPVPSATAIGRFPFMGDRPFTSLPSTPPTRPPRG